MRLLTQLMAYFYVAKYWLYFLFKQKTGLNKQGLNTQQRPVKILVSLTTYPPRLKTVYLAIESLLNQTLKPDKIILWLAKSEIKPKDIPLNLTQLTHRGLDIRWVDENLKSYKKLIYAIEDFSDYHIVTCDDDLMYHHWFLQGLYQSYQKHPDCVSTYRARMMIKTNNNQLTSYNQWQFADTDKPDFAIFPTSGGGTWYPPNALNAQITNRLFMQLAPNADDVWFKAMSLLNHTKSVMVKSHSVDFPAITLNNSQAQTLWQTNIIDNDKQIKAVFDYFKLQTLNTKID